MKKQVKVSSKSDFQLIIALMLASGVKFNRWRRKDETAESYTNEVYPEFNSPIINDTVINCTAASSSYSVLTWPDDAVTIIGELFPQEKKFSLNNVGDYTATIDTDGIRIHTELITFDKFAELEKTLEKTLVEYQNNPYSKTVVKTKSKEDHLTLVKLALKAGRKLSDGNPTAEAYIDRYHEYYPHFLVKTGNDITSCINNYDPSDKIELSWPEDTVQVIDTIFNFKTYTVENVGSYTATFDKKGIQVGCQLIKFDKFAELSDLVKAYKNQ